MAIAPLPSKKPNLQPSNDPTPAPKSGGSPIDAIAALMGVKPVDLAGILADPAAQQLVADALAEFAGLPDLTDPVEAQLARSLVGSSKRRLLARALLDHRATKASARR